MVRKLQRTEIDEVAGIWLDVNLKAHDFIPDRYWKDNYKLVQEMLGQAEVYVYEEENEIQGFVGLDNDYIAGLFVRSGMQSNGIGKQLLDFVKDVKQQLRLNVYQKNTGAVRFYQREDFFVQRESTDENTGEQEYVMIWSNGNGDRGGNAALKMDNLSPELPRLANSGN